MIEACLELALVYHCDPDVFLAKPVHEVEDVYRRTDRMILRMRRGRGAE